MVEKLMQTKEIIWKLNLSSPPNVIFELLDTDQGRNRFWCEKSTEANNTILFEFPNGIKYKGQIQKRVLNRLFKIDYFDSTVTFVLEKNEQGGTILELNNTGVKTTEYLDVKAGWVSVLLNLKSIADYGVDLRNHNHLKTWDQGYVGN